MSGTLEQELAGLIEGSSDYQVRITDSGYLHVHLYYLPVRRIGSSGCLLESGEFAHRLFTRWRRYERASRFVRSHVKRHQRMISSLGGVRL